MALLSSIVDLPAVHAEAPLVLVGLPRSGSTVLSRVINESDNHLFVNDFYYLQFVESVGFDRSDRQAQREFAGFIADQLRNRTRPPGLADEVWFGLPFTQTQLDDIDRYAATIADDGNERSWSDVLVEMMTFAMELTGRTRWGYNTPQDYLHLDRLLAALTDAQFAFLLREPNATLLSYKYYWTVQPDFRADKGRYHPVIQSLAWRTCAEAYHGALDRHGPDRVTLIRFDQLTRSPDRVVERLTHFCELDAPGTIDLAALGHNSSHRRKDATTGEAAQRRLTRVEQQICNRITGVHAARLGFGRPTAERLRADDVTELATVTARNGIYYARKFAGSTNTRRRIVRFARQVSGSRTR